MGHFGILKLALLNINQDQKDSNVHPCCLIGIFTIFCNVLYEKQPNKQNHQPTMYFSFDTKYANMGNSTWRVTWILFYYNLGCLWEKTNSYYFLINSNFLNFLLRHLNHCVVYCTINKEHRIQRQRGYRVQTLIYRITKWQFYKRCEYTEPFKVSHLPWTMRIISVNLLKYVQLTSKYLMTPKCTLLSSSWEKQTNSNEKGNNCMALSLQSGSSNELKHIAMSDH